MWARTAKRVGSATRRLNAPRYQPRLSFARAESSLSAVVENGFDTSGVSLFHKQGPLVNPAPTLVLEQSGLLARWNSRLQGHAEDGNVGRCLSLCKEMHDEGLIPNKATYSALLLALSQQCMYDECMAFFEDMKSLGISPNVEVFAHLIRSAHNSDEPVLEYLLDLMRQEGISPDSTVFHELITRRVLRKELEMCIQLLDDMYELRVDAFLETIESVVLLAAQKNNARMALHLLSSYESNSTRRVGGHIWMNVLIASAQTLFPEGTSTAWEKVTVDSGIIPDEGTCIAVLHCAARHGLPDLAADVIAQIDAMGITKQEYHIAPLIEALAKNGSLRKALESFSYIRAAGVSLNKHSAAPVVAMLTSDIHKTDDAFNLLYDIHADGIAVDVAAMNVVIRAAVALGDLGRAIGVFRAAGDWNVTPNITTFNTLLQGCLETDQDSLHERILEEMQSFEGISANGDTYETLVRLSLKPDVYEDAFFYLTKMGQAGFKLSYSGYEHIVRKCVLNKDPRYELAVTELRESGYEVSSSLQRFIDTGGKSDTPLRERSSSSTMTLDSPRTRDGRFGMKS